MSVKLFKQKDSQGNPIHVIWGIAKNMASPAALVTAYRPKPERWSSDFASRLPPPWIFLIVSTLLYNKDRPLSIIQNSRVEVIVLIPETVDIDEDDEPSETREEILEDFRQAWHEAMTEQTIPISQIWEGIENV